MSLVILVLSLEDLADIMSSLSSTLTTSVEFIVSTYFSVFRNTPFSHLVLKSKDKIQINLIEET